jgi:hypothetical protein
MLNRIIPDLSREASYKYKYSTYWRPARNAFHQLCRRIIWTPALITLQHHLVSYPMYSKASAVRNENQSQSLSDATVSSIHNASIAQQDVFLYQSPRRTSCRKKASISLKNLIASVSNDFFNEQSELWSWTRSLECFQHVCFPIQWRSTAVTDLSLLRSLALLVSPSGESQPYFSIQCC